MSVVVGGGNDGASTKSLSEISEELMVRVGIDLVAAARRNLGFLRTVAESHWLQQRPTILEAIRRYDQLWMPLISDITVGSTPPMVLPPIDIEWVWFCHTLNPASYAQYCESRFSKLIGKPAIFDEGNEDYALIRCRDIWIRRYPSESFENELASDDSISFVPNEDLLGQVLKQRNLYAKLSAPYMLETVYLIAARQRYKRFLYMTQKVLDSCPRLVPAADILLMWVSHQSYPTVYAADVKEMEGDMAKVVAVWEEGSEAEVEKTKKLWEGTFNQPYEKAGGAANGLAPMVNPPFYWEVTDEDVNTRYKSMLPRLLSESKFNTSNTFRKLQHASAEWNGLIFGRTVWLLNDKEIKLNPSPAHSTRIAPNSDYKKVCVFVKLDFKMKAVEGKTSREFLRLRMLRCHRELKSDKQISSFPVGLWQKAWHLYCEFGTRGVVLELHDRGGLCFKGSTMKDTVTFLWNDLLRANSLTLERDVDQRMRVVASMTPPVQAPYLLKCVPDRVTDDSGAMISDLILRMNEYHPQEGRWLSRTVLDHAGRESFVVRMRMGGGFWRRGAESPSPVKWEERIIEIREGSWSYVADSIGRAPVKVVGTATPKEPSEQWNASWEFSTGDELMIRWESSTSISSLNFHLNNETSPDTKVKLLAGRKLQYQKRNTGSKNRDDDGNTITEEEIWPEEEGFVTLVRLSEDNPNGKATALLNWKLLVVEFSPEEDAVFVLLLCISILRSVSEMRKEDVGKLLIRRRLKEAKLGLRDWGSVTLHPSCSFSPSVSSSPYLQPWYWNAKVVMASDDFTRQPASTYSPVEGDDKLFKKSIIS